jgi:hypothetical protein
MSVSADISTERARGDELVMAGALHHGLFYGWGCMVFQ